jgi:hypothetical protein
MTQHRYALITDPRAKPVVFADEMALARRILREAAGEGVQIDPRAVTLWRPGDPVGRFFARIATAPDAASGADPREIGYAFLNDSHHAPARLMSALMRLRIAQGLRGPQPDHAPSHRKAA